MFNRLNPVYKGILLALLGYSAFAVGDICVKWLTSYYSIYELMAIENTFAALILLAFSGFLGGAQSLFDKRNLKINTLRIILNFGLAVFLTYCYRRFPIADVYTMIFTKPFFLAILAMWLYGERGTPSRWLAIIIGFTGVVIAMRPGTTHFDPFMFLPLASATLLALLFICARSLKNPSLFSLGFAPVAGTAILSIIMMLTTSGFQMPPPAHLAVFALLGACAATGFTCVSLAYRTAPSFAVAPFLYVEMLWALAFGYIIFHDAPDLWMLIGATLIIASGIYVIETERRSSRALNP